MEEKKVLYFEVAWEVVNKVGGIHTVIRTKAPVTVQELGADRYFMLGTYDPRFCSTDVELGDPQNASIRQAIETMRNNGTKVFFGKWLIDGYPNVVLFDLNSAYSRIDSWRLELAEKFQINIPWSDKESSDVIVFGGCVAWFLTEVGRRVLPNIAMCAHFHEWLSGVGLIFAKNWMSSGIATLFTTHATLMGRHLSAASHDLYNNLERFNVEKEAGDRRIFHCYQIEKTSAYVADLFTTVSNVTSEEAQALIGKKPDVITPNGLNVVRYAALHEFQNLHVQSKQKINRFVSGHFSGNYDFDLDKTLYFFSAGRYEFTNKGVDLLIEALARFNYNLKCANSDLTVVVFLIFPTKTNNPNVESLKGQALYKQLVDTVDSIKDKIGEKLMGAISRLQLPESESIIDLSDIMKMKKYILSSKRSCPPPICTHNVENDSSDPILRNLRRVKLFNESHNRVKVIFHPEFLSSASPLFPMDYEEFVRGCHLGVFCSYYEPWGYTPAECTVMGIPSVSTNLSGFGEYMQEKVKFPSNYGIYIVDRRTKSYDDSINQLVGYMMDFSSQTRRQRIIQRNRCERLNELLDWKFLGQYYSTARRQALQKVYPKLFTQDKLRHKPKGVSLNLARSLSMSNFTEKDDYEFSCRDDEDDDDDEEEEVDDSRSSEEVVELDENTNDIPKNTPPPAIDTFHPRIHHSTSVPLINVKLTDDNFHKIADMIDSISLQANPKKESVRPHVAYTPIINKYTIYNDGHSSPNTEETVTNLGSETAELIEDNKRTPSKPVILERSSSPSKGVTFTSDYSWCLNGDEESSGVTTDIQSKANEKGSES